MNICSVLQRVAACCSVLQRVAVIELSHETVAKTLAAIIFHVLQCVAACCSVLQRALEEPGTNPSRGALLHTVLDEGT